MREILFRGKDIYGKWLYGDLINLTKEIKQICNHNQLEHAHSVNPETIGQYTGLTDKNGKKIFEGDILEFSDRVVFVFWHTHLGCWDSNFLKFTNRGNSRDDMSPINWDIKAKVVGNIHDNPELMKGGK